MEPVSTHTNSNLISNGDTAIGIATGRGGNTFKNKDKNRYQAIISIRGEIN